MLLAIVGFPLGGFLADRWRKKRMNARLLFPALSSLITGVIFLSAFYFLQGPSQYALILLGGMAASAFSPAAIAVTQDVVHPGLEGDLLQFLRDRPESRWEAPLGPFLWERFRISTASITP